MKVVLDSSVLISASISRAGVCADLFDDVLMHHELIVSDFIVEEVARKLRDKFNFPESDVAQLRRLLLRLAKSVMPEDLPKSDCRDSDGIPVLGTAVAAGAPVLVSVDKDLLALGEYRGARIIRPGDFWRIASG